MERTLTPESDVRQMPIFAALDDEAASSLRASMEEVTLARGEVLFSRGDVGDRLYVLVSGKVKLGRATPDGRENLVAVLGPGDFFGEMALFGDFPRSATATAVTDVTLLALCDEHFRPWLELHPNVAYLLLGALAKRLHRTNDTVGDLVFNDVPARVAKALLDLSERFGTPSDDGSIRVSHDLTQEELAQLVGASRETVNKALADFGSRGWIRLEQRAVILLDTQRLTRRSR